MSLGSEYLAEHEYEREQAEAIWFKAVADASHGIWRTKDGRTLFVEDMTTQHIHNCIRMMERNNNPLLDVYRPMFEKELAKREDNGYFD